MDHQVKTGSSQALPDTALMEAEKRAKLKMKDNLAYILCEMSACERCSLLFLVLTRQDLVSSGYTLCQYSAQGKDITERVWRGCTGSVEALLSALFHVGRYDLLERPLGLCSDHSMQQVCLSEGGLDADRLALYRVFAALPQQTADHILNSYLRSWKCPGDGRPLEETFCRNLSTAGGSYSALLADLHRALCDAGEKHLASVLRPHVQDAAGPSAARLPSAGQQVTDPVYPLPTSHPHGLCVIINVNTFIDAPDPSDETPLQSRRGSDIDTLRLEATFSLFGFVTQPLIDPDLHTIRIFFRNLKEDARLASLQCLVVCIMTHGDEGDRLFLHDRQSLALSELRRLCFTPLLINKPRLFFVQACRGRQVLPPIWSTCAASDLATDGVTTQPVSRESDCLICSATVRGYSAMRSQSAGSWFISDLCKALQEIGHLSPIRCVLQQARRSLNDRVDRLGNHIVMQTSEDITTLLREVQLVRGTAEHFSLGCMLLLLLQLMEELIDEAVEVYCNQLELGSSEMMRLVQQVHEEELMYQAMGY